MAVITQERMVSIVLISFSIVNRCCLTVSGDLIGRVEPPVPARRGADVHVEMDVVSQPVAGLLVPHKYRLLPVLQPFTERKKTTTGRLMTKVAPFITASGIDFHFLFSNDEVRPGRREMDTGPLSDHSPFSCCHTRLLDITQAAGREGEGV